MDILLSFVSINKSRSGCGRGELGCLCLSSVAPPDPVSPHRSGPPALLLPACWGVAVPDGHGETRSSSWHSAVSRTSAGAQSDSPFHLEFDGTCHLFLTGPVSTQSVLWQLQTDTQGLSLCFSLDQHIEPWCRVQELQGRPGQDQDHCWISPMPSHSVYALLLIGWKHL